MDKSQPHFTPNPQTHIIISIMGHVIKNHAGTASHMGNFYVYTEFVALMNTLSLKAKLWPTTFIQPITP